MNGPRGSVPPAKLRPEIVRQRPAPARLRPLLRPRAGRMVLVHAPAGYGKTAMLAATQPARRAWYNLDPADRSPLALAHGLAAAIGLPALPPDLADDGHAVAVALAERLEGRRLTITLDRWEQVGDAPEIGRLLAELLLVPGVALRLATRVRPALPIERLRVEGRLVEVGTAELRLERTEIDRLLTEAWGRPPGPAALRFADAVVAGWPAALELWQADLRGEVDPVAPLQPGRPLHDYLHEEVLRTLPDEVRAVLQAGGSWLLEPGPLPDRAPTPEQQLVLDTLLRDRVGLVPAADGWRLHPLVALFAQMHACMRRAPAADRPSIAIRTFGGLRVSVGGAAVDDSAWPVSARRLLELLLCLPGHRTTAQEAATLLWPSHLPRSALNSFNVALHRLRRVLEPGLTARAASRTVVREGRTYRLRTERVDCDLLRFERLVARPEDGVPSLEQAAELYCGDFLDGSTERFAEVRRVQLRQTALDALERLASAHRRAGDGEQAIRRYERLLGLAPRREDVWARLLEHHLHAGDTHRALAALRRCLQALQEAGLQPSGLLRELQRRIKGGLIHPAGPQARQIGAVRQVGPPSPLSEISEPS